MLDSQWETLVSLMTEAKQIEFADGLSTAELKSIEQQFGFRFPPDLSEFLQTSLPVSDGFPNWRFESHESIKARLEIPMEGVLFDVEHNNFWQSSWGHRPEKQSEALAIAGGLIRAAPKLIPIYKHRMICESPCEKGNPVFSVHQTDIIYYGIDLRDYLIHEFIAENFGYWPIPDDIRQIEFWDINNFLKDRWSRGPVKFDNRKELLPDQEQR